MSNHVYDVIIIGGGPAGYTAAMYSVRSGLDTLVVEKLSAGGQMTQTSQIDNYPGFDDGIDGFTLGFRMQNGAERFGAVTMNTEVLSVMLEGDTKFIVTANGTLSARTVIIATGAQHKQLGLENEDKLTGRGVSYCASCDGMFYKGKTAVVVGGGNSAASDALVLSKICSKVYVVHRRDTLRATKIYHEPLFKADNVEFIWNSTVSEILFDEAVTGVLVTDKSTAEKRRLECDGLFVSIGRAPATDIFKHQIQTDKFGYIIAGEDTKTNIEGVFAAGDVRTKDFRQIVTAASDGAVAAYNAELYLA